MTLFTAARWKLAAAAALLRRGDYGTLLLLAAQRLPGVGKRIRMIVLTKSHSIPSLPVPRNVFYRRLLPGEPLPLGVLSRLQAGPPPEVRQARFLEALSRGSEGFVAEVDGRIVGYAWAAFQRHSIPEARFDLVLEPDEACTYASYVLKEFRYSRVYGGLARFMLTSLRERGIRSFVGYAHMSSRTSISTHGRMGYRTLGWILLIRLPFIDVQVTRFGSAGRRRWRFMTPADTTGAAPKAVETGKHSASYIRSALSIEGMNR